MTVLASRVFYLEDQQQFARLSSDSNPIHLDEGFARRTQAGAVVVHGIHNLLWAVDAACRRIPDLRIRSLKVRFLQPLFLGETVQVQIGQKNDRLITLDVTVGNILIATITLSSQEGAQQGDLARRDTSAAQSPAVPINMGFEHLSGHAGAVRSASSDSDVISWFPALAAALGIAALRGLLATSQIVGMCCPGLHSLFVGLAVSFHPDLPAVDVLHYAVVKADARFRSVAIDVFGLAIAGRLDAFARPAPPLQRSMSAVARHVAPGVFAGQTALIIGGSRGLGEITGKLIAAGGGHPILTYYREPVEVGRVADEIRGAGGTCDVMAYNVLDSARKQLASMTTAPRFLYYFATSKIFLRKSDLYEEDTFRGFLPYYVDGFYDLCTALIEDAGQDIRAFYPSSLAVDEGVNTIAEYAMAKAAGEILCKYMNDFISNISVVLHRLPRILTDQTSTVGVAATADAFEVMLPIVHEVQAAADGMALDVASE